MDVLKTLKIINDFYEAVQQEKDFLNNLDNAIGDSDHGTNIFKGLENFHKLQAQKTYQTSSEVWKELAMSFLTKVGGASGPLYGSAFLTMAKCPDTTPMWGLLDAGANLIKVLGKSDINQKTMLDVWIPGTLLLKEQHLTEEKINNLVEATKTIPAIKGRASYLGERALGHIDPGAYSTGLFLKAILKVGV